MTHGAALGSSTAVAARPDTACQHGPSCTLRADRPGRRLPRAGAQHGGIWGAAVLALGCASPGAVQKLQRLHPAAEQSDPSHPASVRLWVPLGALPCTGTARRAAEPAVMAGREEPAQQRSQRSARRSECGGERRPEVLLSLLAESPGAAKRAPRGGLGTAGSFHVTAGRAGRGGVKAGLCRSTRPPSEERHRDASLGGSVWLAPRELQKQRASSWRALSEAA